MSGVAAVAAAIATFSLTPAGSLAQNFIDLFQPQQVATVQVSVADVRALSQLQHFGRVTPPGKVAPQQASDAAAASAMSGMHVVSPSFRPAGTPNAPEYQVLPGGTASFTFSAAKSKAWAAAHHRPLPAIPAGIDGSKLTVSTGDTVVATYTSGKNSLPELAIGQTRAPHIGTTGASLSQMEAFILTLPGVSPSLRSQLRALGDPTTSLVLPIPADLASSHPVVVDGVHGVAISDSTGLGSMVIWEKEGIIYGVGGTLSENDAIQTANTLG
jgi:hypothetical protein